MLKKRIKSVLVAGLLMIGITGSAFAEGNGNDGCQVPGLRGEHNGNSHHVSQITESSWNVYVEEFNRINAEKFEIVPSGGKYKVMDLTTGKQIEIIHVDFNKELTEEQKEAKRPKPEVPNLPTEEPETGDVSIMPIVAIAAMSAAGLYVIKKKDDEE